MTYPESRYLGPDGEKTTRMRAAASSPDLARADGTAIHYLATGASTDGLFGLYRLDMGPAAAGAAPHFHRTMAESFFVLAGAMRVFDGNEWRDAGPGDFVHVPPGGIHGFSNDSGAPASMLIHFAPGAPREAYFEGLDGVAAMSPEDREAFFRLHDNLWVR